MALWLLLVLCLPVAMLRAQSLTLFVSGVTADSTSPAPSVTLTPVGLDRFNGPFTYTLELSDLSQQD